VCVPTAREERLIGAFVTLVEPLARPTTSARAATRDAETTEICHTELLLVLRNDAGASRLTMQV